MRNKLALMSFLVILTLAAGCNHETSPQPKNGGSFIGGDKALELSFIDSSPPAEVTDKLEGESGFPFDVTLVMENVGEYSILPNQQMFVTLSGFFHSDFGIADPDKELSIIYPGVGGSTFSGKKKDTEGNQIQGDVAYIRFPKTKSLDILYGKPIPVSIPFPFRAEVCYPYLTNTVSELCLMNNLMSKDQSVCNPNEEKSVSNSGGPMEVSSVTQSSAGKDKIVIRFDVKKVGDSDLFDYVDNNGCEDNLRNKNRLLIQVKTGLEGLSCTGIGGEGLTETSSKYVAWAGTLLLSPEGKGSFTCIQTLEGKDRRDAIKTIGIETLYYARDSVATEVLVKHSLS